MRNQILLLILICAQITALADTYYVRVDGNDGNTGASNSSSGAWGTINYAVNRLQSGDTLYLNNGEYRIDPIKLRYLTGYEDAPTVIKSIQPWGAKIRLAGDPVWGNIIEIFGCSYIEIDGLEVYAVDPHKGTGIQASENSHHITIKNCFVHDCGCGGISGRGSDYITVENNVTMGNATRSEYNCSGISLFLPEYSDYADGYHMIIRGNVSFNNECRLPFAPGGFTTPTDGNGIILDLFKNPFNSTDEGQLGGYYAASLIENNLCFNNGGRGINIYHADNVTVRNNTLWHNLHVLAEYDQWKGDIESFESRNQHWYNNITVKDNNLPTEAMRGYKIGETGSEIFNNIIVGQKDFWPEKPEEKNNILMDGSEQEFVKFNNPTSDVEFSSRKDFIAYFGLQQESPAINSAYTEASETDIDGVKREAEHADIGCYEYRWPLAAFSKTDNNEADIRYLPYSNELIVNVREEYLITLYSLGGDVVYVSKIMKGINTLRLTQIPKGVYFAKISGDKNSKSRKIVIH